MTAKDVTFGADARSRMIEGVELLGADELGLGTSTGPDSAKAG